MASRIDACASRIETAVRMGQVTDSMKGVVKGMDKGLQSMNIEEISATMDKFEQQFEDLDVKVSVIVKSMRVYCTVLFVGDNVLFCLSAIDHAWFCVFVITTRRTYAVTC